MLYLYYKEKGTVDISAFESDYILVWLNHELLWRCITLSSGQPRVRCHLHTHTRQFCQSEPLNIAIAQCYYHSRGSALLSLTLHSHCFTTPADDSFTKAGAPFALYMACYIRPALILVSLLYFKAATLYK